MTAECRPPEGTPDRVLCWLIAAESINSILSQFHQDLN